MLNHLKEKFRRFMVGRYGTDELNRFLSMLILVFVAFHLFTRNIMFFWMELLCLILIYVRMFSRDTGRRFKENQIYLHTCFQAGEWVRRFGSRLKECRKFKIFKCPQCGQKLRIPRGHGKIQVHCRSCGHDFIGRS